ncbi:hypothetical protein DXG03_009771 [Asterophora parasitica]|uniref:Protein kinase domain-containing protein n=1 Tax=Asterophora parasitica TaxID=117018 RepID=A0A9P7FY47_9AGAR|nr:hypothetical protein DXG03_009771 [Asterophora parasitica]
MEHLEKELRKHLRIFFDHNPADLVIRRSCPSLAEAPPTTFYEKHLDERLSLKKIVFLPTFATNLSRTVDESLQSLHDNNMSLPPTRPQFPSLEWLQDVGGRPLASDAQSVGHAYRIETSYFARILASTILLHNRAPLWCSSLLFSSKASRENEPSETFYVRLLEPYDHSPGDKGLTIPEEAWDSMEDAQQELCRQIYNRFAVLATWEMLFTSKEAEGALMAMEIVSSRDVSSYTRPRTLAPGWRAPDLHLSMPPDAIDTMWQTTLSSFLNSPQPPEAGRTNTSSRLAKPGSNDTRWSDVVIHEKMTSTNTGEEIAEAVIQRAWARAVKDDASFVVFHCGTFERIAYRHRSSQIFFISELIDVRKCKAPGYGKIHIGLMMAIIQDVHDRALQIIHDEQSAPLTRDVPQRINTDTGVQEPTCKNEDLQVVLQEASLRPLALLRMQHLHFNSPVPASLLRIDSDGGSSRKTHFKPTEYFCLTITSPIASGATGEAHNASIELLSSTGKTLSFSDVVVKLAFRPDQRLRMRHEFEVYQHLTLAGTTGIPVVFGLFEDVESETLALVMNNVGKSIIERIEDDKIRISESERTAFIKVLKSIHAAGVRHRDIRPENMVINEEGVVSIIDFDKAQMNASQRSMDAEREYLLWVLDTDVIVRELAGYRRISSATD